MGKHSKQDKTIPTIAGTVVRASTIKQKYQDRLDWHEKIITGTRQEKNPSEPIVWPNELRFSV